MSKFIFTYHGDKMPETPEEGQKSMQEWKEWVATLGFSLIDPGTPVGITKVISKNGASDQKSINPIMGFSMLEANDIDHAIELLKDRPHLKHEGTLEISEMMEMSM